MKDLSKPVYIRNNMDVLIEELMEELDESWYYVWLCKEVADDPNLSQRGTGPNKFPYLTQDMKDFLQESSDNIDRTELARRFNREFKDSSVTPIKRNAIMRHKMKIRGQKKERVKNK